MRIERVQVGVRDFATAARFFSDGLGLPVELSRSQLHARVGRSRLVLTEGGGTGPGVHHLAFDVPAATFPVHRDWLAARVPLLAAADGATEFEGPAGWNSRSVYFEGPDGMVLELIARRSRAGSAAAVPHLESISEVGIAVTDVPAAVSALRRAWGIEPFNGTADDFAPVGDEEGLLILVAPGRPWYPTQQVVAGPLPLAVDLAVDAPGRALELAPLASLRAVPPA